MDNIKYKWLIVLLLSISTIAKGEITDDDLLKTKMSIRVNPMFMILNPPSNIYERSGAILIRNPTASIMFQQLFGNRHSIELTGISFTNIRKSYPQFGVEATYSYDAFINKKKFFKRRLQPYISPYLQLGFSSSKSPIYYFKDKVSQDSGFKTFADEKTIGFRAKVGVGFGIRYAITSRLNFEPTILFKAYDFEVINSKIDGLTSITNNSLTGFDGTDIFIKVGFTFNLFDNLKYKGIDTQEE